MIKYFLALCLLLSGINIRAQEHTQKYIEDNAEKAVTLMREHKVPASIILGVAIHESASGKSKIARHLNNHFGIKGRNSSRKIRSSYKSYDAVEESYEDFVGLLETRSPFNKLFDKYTPYDYKGWARGIQRSGYAHSRTWSRQVIALIKKYDLSKYDDRPEGYQEPPDEPVIARKRHKHHSSKHVYKVKKGDNLSVIAKKHKTTTKALMKKNGLHSNKLKPGQKIKI